MWESRVQSLRQEDSLEKGMATHCSVFAWETPRTEEPGRLQSLGSRRVRHDSAPNTEKDMDWNVGNLTSNCDPSSHLMYIQWTPVLSNSVNQSK